MDDLQAAFIAASNLVPHDGLNDIRSTATHVARLGLEIQGHMSAARRAVQAQRDAMQDKQAEEQAARDLAWQMRDEARSKAQQHTSAASAGEPWAAAKRDGIDYP